MRHGEDRAVGKVLANGLLDLAVGSGVDASSSCFVFGGGKQRMVRNRLLKAMLGKILQERTLSHKHK